MVHFQLVALSGVKVDDDVYEVILPTADGLMAVLQNHMPLVSVASSGVISVRRNERDRDDQMEVYATNGGVIEVQNNTLKVLVDEADHADDINEAEARAAVERAQQMLAEASDQVSLDHAQTLVDRNKVRLQVANIRRRSGKR